MDVFAFVGLPFVTLLAAFVFGGYSIGGHAAAPDDSPAAPGGRLRVTRAALLLVAAATALGAAAVAAAGGSFSRLTDGGYVIEPAALIFTLEAAVDAALVSLVVIPGWSMTRAWIIRTVGVYWLCALLPGLVLADPGPGGSDALPAMVAEAVAVIIGTVLLWIATVSPGSASEAE